MAPELKWSVCAVEGPKHLENFCYVTFTQKVENLRQPVTSRMKTNWLVW